MTPLPETPQPAPAQARDYAAAVAAVLAAAAFQYLLNPVPGLQPGTYLILLFPVVLAALAGGFGPGLLATLLGAGIAAFLLVRQSDGLAAVADWHDLGRMVLFVAAGTGMAIFGGRLRTSRHFLNTTVEQLRASNQAKDNAMATLGHEIRNPLSALLSAQQLLALAGQDPAQVLRVSELIGRQVAQLTRMADDLQDLSGVLQHDALEQSQPVDLHHVLEQALEQTRPLIEAKGHRLFTDLSSQPVLVLGEASRLVQVFANLLNNAAKYTGVGGELTLILHPPTARNVKVTVHDNGIGMDPATCEAMFALFARAPGAAAEAEAGLGLGLTVVRKIVALHGGEVAARSAGLGRGCTVTVRLPLDLPAGETSTNRTPLESAFGRN